MSTDQNAQYCGCDRGVFPPHFCREHRARKSCDWVGVDFDGVLVLWDPSYLPDCGAPIAAGIDLVLNLLASGVEVRIFTARMEPSLDEPEWWDTVIALGFKSAEEWAIYQQKMIDRFCLEQFGRPLRITAAKDWKMIRYYDDRCVEMISNTGQPRITA